MPASFPVPPVMTDVPCVTPRLSASPDAAESLSVVKYWSPSGRVKTQELA
jgi:hypothetical protein